MVEGMALNNLANLEWTVGDPGRAMEGFARAAAFQSRRGRYREAIIPRINLAYCLAELGDVVAARDTLRACLEESQELSAPDLESMAWESLGRLSLKQGEWGEAAALFRKALQRGEGLQFEAVRNSLLGLSTALARRDSSRTALEVLEMGQSWCHLGGEVAFCARLELAWGRRLLELEELVEAARHFERADSIAAAGGVQQLRVAALTSLAEDLEKLDRPAEVEKVLDRAVEVWEAERGLPMDPDWRSLRGAQGRRLFTDLAAFWILRPRGAEKAFDVLQRYKGRGLLERLRGPDATGDGGELETVDAADLRTKVLRPGEILLDVYLGPEHSVLFAVDRKECRAWLLPPEDDLEPRISRLGEELFQPQGAIPPELFEEIAAALAGELFGPILNELPSCSSVLFSPDGVLNLLPPALFEKPGGPRWSRIPSAGVLAFLRNGEGATERTGRRPRSETELLILSAGRRSDGVLLPGAQREGRWLADHFAGVEFFQPLDPTRSAEILHVAAHTIADDRRPWRSRIVLDQGPDLTARKLMEEKRPIRLAVLASCGSATGRTLSGEGVQSLSTALLAGGAGAVVATLWPVEDEATFAFMRRFYREMADGVAAGEALHRAQESFRRSRDRAQPFYWAAFVLEGEPGLRVDLHRKASGLRWLLPAAILFVLLLYLSVRILRRRV